MRARMSDRWLCATQAGELQCERQKIKSHRLIMTSACEQTRAPAALQVCMCFFSSYSIYRDAAITLRLLMMCSLVLSRFAHAGMFTLYLRNSRWATLTHTMQEKTNGQKIWREKNTQTLTCSTLLCKFLRAARSRTSHPCNRSCTNIGFYPGALAPVQNIHICLRVCVCPFRERYASRAACERANRCLSNHPHTHAHTLTHFVLRVSPFARTEYTHIHLRAMGNAIIAYSSCIHINAESSRFHMGNACVVCVSDYRRNVCTIFMEILNTRHANPTRVCVLDIGEYRPQKSHVNIPVHKQMLGYIVTSPCERVRAIFDTKACFAPDLRTYNDRVCVNRVHQYHEYLPDTHTPTHLTLAPMEYPYNGAATTHTIKLVELSGSPIVAHTYVAGGNRGGLFIIEQVTCSKAIQ